MTYRKSRSYPQNPYDDSAPDVPDEHVTAEVERWERGNGGVEPRVAEVTWVDSASLNRIKQEVWNKALPQDRKTGVLTLAEERILVQQVCLYIEQQLKIKTLLREALRA